MAELQAWERQPGESGPAFAAFVVYRDLGPYRSLDKAYKTQKPDADKFSGQWSLWSAEHKWLERALAYDSYCDAERRKVLEQKLRDLEARRVEFEFENQDALERWVRDLDGELRAAIDEGYTETEEELERGPAGENGEPGELRIVKRSVKIKFPALGAVARVLKERNETARQAIEGPRKNPAPEADAGKNASGTGGAYVWVKPKPETEPE